ncbi:Hypothetical_protein [Hexamita inflata]|uniref:Hypothetical_protein n=1 Tax=Hexamita inflata TaxID=28002 RepID=A0ABP1GGF5_9EUKA
MEPERPEYKKQVTVYQQHKCPTQSFHLRLISHVNQQIKICKFGSYLWNYLRMAVLALSLHNQLFLYSYTNITTAVSIFFTNLQASFYKDFVITSSLQIKTVDLFQQ